MEYVDSAARVVTHEDPVNVPLDAVISARTRCCPKTLVVPECAGNDLPVIATRGYQEEARVSAPKFATTISGGVGCNGARMNACSAEVVDPTVRFHTWLVALVAAARRALFSPTLVAADPPVVLAKATPPEPADAASLTTGEEFDAPCRAPKQ